MNDIIRAIESEQLRSDLPEIRVGDTVRVNYRVVEGTRERLQAFEGVLQETFTVRRVSYGIGVERTVPVHSPRIGDITVVRGSKVRRAKLYFLRDRVGKAARLKEVRR